MSELIQAISLNVARSGMYVDPNGGTAKALNVLMFFMGVFVIVRAVFVMNRVPSGGKGRGILFLLLGILLVAISLGILKTGAAGVR